MTSIIYLHINYTHKSFLASFFNTLYNDDVL